MGFLYHSFITLGFSKISSSFLIKGITSLNAPILWSNISVIGRSFLVPISTLFDMSDGLLSYAIKWGVFIGLMLVYMVLHELVHGVFMKRFSGVKPNYGYTGMYAYAGSNAYFDKKSYIIII